MSDPVSRFWAKVDLTQQVTRAELTPCWLWCGAVNEDGYGLMKVDGRKRRVHRLSYTWFAGEIGNLCVLHKCNTPACVRPDHLYLGTQQNRMRNGKSVKGERNGMARLTEKQVKEIRASDMSLKDIAYVYAIAVPTVSNIRKRRRWAHVE